MRKILPALLAVAILATGAGGFLFYWYGRAPARPDLARLGGTLLTFEADGEPPAGVTPEALAGAVRRRIDPSGREGVTAGPAGDWRVEVGVPDTPHAAELIERIPELLSRAGLLEFLILANRTDDVEALECWERLQADRDKLAEGEKANRPPPLPETEKGRREFFVRLPKDGFHRYRWLTLSEAYVKSFSLDPDSLDDPVHEFCRNDLMKAVTDHHPISRFRERHLFYGHRPPGTDAPRFFVLAREPNQGEEVTSAFLETARLGMPPKHAPGQSINFTLTEEGGERFHRLTSQNRPTPDQRRLLAVVLDGEVLTDPTLNSPIRREGQITGAFTEKEAEALATLLRTGALPVRFKPRPVSRSTRAPGP